MRKFLSYIIGLALVFPLMSLASVVTLDATATGWYNPQISNQGGNYYTGYNPHQGEYRSYFVFDLSSISGTIQSALLHIYSDNGYISGGVTSLVFSDVTTPVQTLISTNYNPTAIFDDLGTGKILGSLTLDNSVTHYSGRYFDILLNLDGLSALQSRQGSLFAFGGSLTNLYPNAIFGNTSANNIRQLTVSYTEPIINVNVPEPDAVWLIASSLVLLSLTRWKKTAN